MKDPAFPTGPIQLQTLGCQIRWRNVFIREIPAAVVNKEEFENVIVRVESKLPPRGHLHDDAAAHR